MQKEKSRVNFVVGLIVLLLAFIGVASILNLAISSVKTNINEKNYKEYASYEELISPVIMNDPDTFDDITKADMSQLLSIAIWSLLGSDLSPQTYEYTDTGMLLPVKDVEGEFATLFGGELKAVHMSVDGGEGVEFSYSEDKKCYVIPITGITPIYTPEVLSVSHKTDSVVLNVGYLASSEWQQDSNGEMVKPEHAKIMKITLGKSSDGGFYVRAIQSAE